jgi:hypothetical protein
VGDGTGGHHRRLAGAHDRLRYQRPGSVEPNIIEAGDGEAIIAHLTAALDQIESLVELRQNRGAFVSSLTIEEAGRCSTPTSVSSVKYFRGWR